MLPVENRKGVPSYLLSPGNKAHQSSPRDAFCLSFDQVLCHEVRASEYLAALALEQVDGPKGYKPSSSGFSVWDDTASTSALNPNRKLPECRKEPSHPGLFAGAGFNGNLEGA